MITATGSHVVSDQADVSPGDSSVCPGDATENSRGQKLGKCDVMITYHHTDENLLERIAASLSDRGFSVCHSCHGTIDPQNGKAILDTKVFMFIVSQASLSHTPCKDEAALAYIAGKPVIPIGVQSYKDLEPHLDSAMKMLLAKLNWSFFVTEEDWDRHLPEMTDSISDLVDAMDVTETSFTDESEFDVKYNSMTETKQRLVISLRRTHSVPQADLLTGTFEGVDFWDAHFSGEESVSREIFVDNFLLDFDVQLMELAAEVQHPSHELEDTERHEALQEWIEQLLCDLFGEGEMVDRATYDNVCYTKLSRPNNQAESTSDIFYNRVKDFVIGKRAMLKVFNMESSVRLLAIQNLGRYQSPEIVAGLIDLLEDPDPNIRTVATLALGRCESSNIIISKLLVMISDPDRLVRQATCISLGHLRAAEAVPVLVGVWRNEDISDVRDAAFAALERMQGDEAKIAIEMTRKLEKEVERLRRDTSSGTHCH